MTNKQHYCFLLKIVLVTIRKLLTILSLLIQQVMDWLALQDEEKLPDVKSGDEFAVLEVSKISFVLLKCWIENMISRSCSNYIGV